MIFRSYDDIRSRSKRSRRRLPVANSSHARAHPRDHAARLHALDLHFIAAPDEVVASQGADEQRRQQQVANEPIERRQRRDVPAGGSGERHFGAVPQRGKAGHAKRHRQAERTGQKRDADHRKYAAGKDFRQEIQQKTRSPQPRPAQLAIPDFGGAAPAERLRQRPINQPHLKTGAAHHFGRHGVLGDLLAERLDAARGVKIGAPPQHGLALRETEAERVDDILPARLIGVEESAFDLRPNPGRPATDGRRGDKSGVVAPARE